MELIVQPDDEAAVRGDWPRGHSDCARHRHRRKTHNNSRSSTGRATRTCGVERAKVYEEQPACFVVRDDNGEAFTYVLFRGRAIDQKKWGFIFPLRC